MTEPNTLDDLLALLPGLRRQRSLNADWLRTLLDRQKGQCTWCGEAVPGRRQTWCSDGCVEAYKLRCDSAYQMKFVLKRDAGICQECGLDTHEAERAFAKLPYEDRVVVGVRVVKGREYRTTTHAETRGYGRGTWREVDHIVPVAQGGGLTGPDNLRLVCGECHAGATKRLAGELAAARRAR